MMELKKEVSARITTARIVTHDFDWDFPHLQELVSYFRLPGPTKIG
jgi:hypothetical protein